MSLEETLTQLEALGNERMRAQNTKNGAGDNQFGVRLGDLRKLAKKIKTNHELATALWETGNIDARLLAILLIKPMSLAAEEMNRMVRSVTFVQVADWLNAYVVKRHPDKESLRQAWMVSDEPMAARAGWSLTAERIVKNPEGLNLPALLDCLKADMDNAVTEVQWTMNNSLAEIEIHFSDHRQRALAIGEKLGVYRDYPFSRGCTSPFAPIWINEIVSRQGWSASRLNRILSRTGAEEVRCPTPESRDEVDSDCLASLNRSVWPAHDDRSSNRATIHWNLILMIQWIYS